MLTFRLSTCSDVTQRHPNEATSSCPIVPFNSFGSAPWISRDFATWRIKYPPSQKTDFTAGTCHQLARGSPGSRKPTRSFSRKCSPAVLHIVKRCEVLRRYEVNTLPKTSSFSQGMSLSSQTPRLKERFIV